jgi:hypothetical protein
VDAAGPNEAGEHDTAVDGEQRPNAVAHLFDFLCEREQPFSLRGLLP